MKHFRNLKLQNMQNPSLPPIVCQQQTGSKSEKEYIKAVYCHPAYLYAENITRNARLDEAQAGIKIVGRNISNLRYADDTILMAESKEELKSLLMKEESEKPGLKFSIQKTKIIDSIWSHHFMGNRWGNSGNSVRLYFSGLQNHYRW